MNDPIKSHGGKRPGAGRKPCHGVKEPTTVIRVPASTAGTVKDFVSVFMQKRTLENLDPVSGFEYPVLDATRLELPLFGYKVPAGIPSPADDHVEKRLDPNNFLIDDNDNTFFVTIQGYSMIDVGLMPGDKAVVDRSKVASIGDIVLAVIDGEFTIKTLGKTRSGAPRLLPANSGGNYVPIEINEEMRFEIWGVVTGSFRRFR
ncbi:DNA polymerase V [Methylophilaceae bacterium]|nr:DNA polymerase V [Methylophilaceae bacterium]